MSNVRSNVGLFCLALVAGLPACLQQSISFSPGPGASNVPVNVAIRVTYFSNAPLRASEVRRENFALKECPSTGFGSISTNTETKDNATSEKPVDVRLTLRTYGKLPTKCADKNKDCWRSDVVILPTAPSPDDLPLLENKAYCVETQPVKDKEGKLLPAGTSTFTTEENPEFAFADRAVLQTWPWIQNSNVSRKDLIVVRFDGPVLPNSLKNGTSVCQKPEPGATVTQARGAESDNPCGNGQEARYRLLQVESFSPREKDGLTLANYETFGISGESFQADAEYSLFLGFSKEGRRAEQDPGLEFKVTAADPSNSNEILANKFGLKNVSYVPGETRELSKDDM